MKKAATLSVTLMLCIFLFGQKPFAPLGARWGSVIHCTPCTWSCPPGYPYHYTFEVTEDTIIQGKYCTVIKDPDWSNWEERSIIHQDGHQIYRYDRIDETFKLVLDFSKEVGESWQIEISDYWYSTNIFKITVTEKAGSYRQVSIDGVFEEGEYPVFLGLPLYEGFGGLEQNYRLLIGAELFIVSDPFYRDELTCYIDPDEGLLYGNASSCEMTNTSFQEAEKQFFNVYPNPASNQLTLESNYPSGRDTEWILYDAMGNVIKKQVLTNGIEQTSIRLDNLTNGLYFWKVFEAGEVIGVGKVIVSR